MKTVGCIGLNFHDIQRFSKLQSAICKNLPNDDDICIVIVGSDDVAIRESNFFKESGSSSFIQHANHYKYFGKIQ